MSRSRSVPAGESRSFSGENKMSYCLNPDCSQPQNFAESVFCQACGKSLVLHRQYRAIAPLGKGGFGRTFLANNGTQQCVIKQLYLKGFDPWESQKAKELFEQEAVRLQELGQHPQIPSSLAAFEEGDRLYLVQDFIDGQTLENEVRQKGTFNEVKIRALLKDLLPVLKFIHERNVLHRDIKPANLMRRQSDGKIVLIDFGGAKFVSSAAYIKTGTIIGSPEYISPEQNRGKAFPASDIYSLGVTCIHLMTKFSPLDLFDIVDRRWKWRNCLPGGSSVSDRLAAILDRMLEESLKLRYKSASEVLKDLDPPVKVAKPKTTSKPRPKVPPKRGFFANLLGISSVSPEDDDLSSEVGIDYANLQHFLAVQQWQSADRETCRLLAIAVGKGERTPLDRRDIAKLPCPDLETIDRLWVKYSGGRFGFSVQQEIYNEVGCDYLKFCDRVGWTIARSLTTAEPLQYKNSAPIGHLPSRSWAGGSKWWQLIPLLGERLKQCKI